MRAAKGFRAISFPATSPPCQFGLLRCNGMRLPCAFGSPPTYRAGTFNESRNTAQPSPPNTAKDAST
jgi:hypothetical protein